jgi:hypothetical protein
MFLSCWQNEIAAFECLWTAMFSLPLSEDCKIDWFDQAGKLTNIQSPNVSNLNFWQ